MYPTRFQPQRNIFGNNGYEDPYSYPYKNIMFDNPAESNPYDINSQPEPKPNPQFMDAYAELMKRQSGPAMSAYSKFVQQGPPKEQDYKPSKMRRLGAILAGAATGYGSGAAAGYKLSSDIVKEPYEDALKKNQLQGSYLREGANLEDTTYQRQLSTMNQMRLAENQRIDNDRAERTLQNTIKRDNLNMQRTLMQIDQMGWKPHLDKATGILYSVNENNGKRLALGKYDLNTNERIGEADTKAQNASRLVEGRNERSQRRQFANATEMQNARFEHDDKKTTSTSVNQVMSKNAVNVDALVKTNPNKYKNVYGFNSTTQSFEIKNPLAEKGFPRKADNSVDWDQITPEQIDDYNAFVDVHNANINGIADDKKLEKVSKYKPVVPKKQSALPISPYYGGRV